MYTLQYNITTATLAAAAAAAYSMKLTTANCSNRQQLASTGGSVV